MKRPAIALCVAAAAFGLLGSAVAAGKTERLIVLQDGQPYFQGSYSAYASPWSTFFDKTLVHGTDYLDTITVRPSTFPNGTLIETRWPTTTPVKSGVWGYHAVSFGNYDGGKTPKAVTPRRVKDIRKLEQAFAFAYSGSTNFNLLSEFYLTSRAGNAAAKVIEIGYFLHTPPSSARYNRAATPLGAFTDSAGRGWMITQAKTYVMVTPTDARDIPRGRIDIRELLDLLVRKGVISGDEWFNGIAFGMEPTEGGGRTRLRIIHWRVVYG